MLLGPDQRPIGSDAEKHEQNIRLIVTTITSINDLRQASVATATVANALTAMTRALHVMAGLFGTAPTREELAACAKRMMNSAQE